MFKVQATGKCNIKSLLLSTAHLVFVFDCNVNYIGRSTLNSYFVSEFLVGISTYFHQNIWLWLDFFFNVLIFYLFIALDVEWSIYGFLYNWADEMSNLNVFSWLEWISVCSYSFLTIYIILHCLGLCSFICLFIFAILMVLFAFFVSTSSWFWLIYRITKCVTIWKTIIYTKTTYTRSLAHSRAWHSDI